MSPLLMTSTVLITLALVFYSIGVWSERLQRYLRPWHLYAFWLGLAFDASGTYAMGLIRHGFDVTGNHTLTGQLALWLMAFHAAWATVVVVRGHEKAKHTFHSFSLLVWLIWLVPYLAGAIAGMARL